MTISVQAARVDLPTVEPRRPAAPEWGSDLVAEMLRRLQVEYVALNPGASFRGLHDSLVNYNGNRDPSIILCNHEEVAVAIAHGFAKLRGRAMAAAVHSNVGLMHAAMAVFNAYADRAPIFLLGGNGPMDALKRRPWIEWIHTTHGQGELVREYTKWEHQPASAAATPEALVRAWHTAHIPPCGPVYVDLDAGIQEQRLDPAQPMQLPRLNDFPVPAPPVAAPELIQQAARWLVEATYPVILPGRLAPTQAAWDDLRALAELLGAAVLLDRRATGAFPTHHYLCQSGIGNRAAREASDVLQQADVVLALERNDPAGTLRGTAPRLINVSLEPMLMSSWVADYQALPQAALPILAPPESTVAQLRASVDRLLAENHGARRRAEQRTDAHHQRRTRLESSWSEHRARTWDLTPVTATRVVGELRAALGGRADDAILAYMPLAWPDGIWDFSKPGAYLGGDGGAGVGAGPGLTVGATLAAANTDRAVIGLVGDGAMLMTPTALWTAAHHHLPALLVVMNNQSYYNDEEHQERVAVTRGRPLENRWIGQRMDAPPVDFARLAESLGVEGIGPIDAPHQVRSAMDRAVAAINDGRPVLVDVRISPR
jgi:thiamine pyrophosphate-dependent acetolactate synthase large subunit-like protein